MDWKLLLLLVLLPVAALSGWRAGRREGGSRAAGHDHANARANYYKGLNYLLNEQPDEAVEVFLQLSEVDSETAELHFTLGNLFRRRGEVDRAIRIHQNLIARPTLDRKQRNQALYELGLDYMSAGLLDRAESLMWELVEELAYRQRSLQQLMKIYQDEKDWEKAIEVAHRLSKSGEEGMGVISAQYYCELADAALNEGRTEAVQRLLKRAYADDRNCVRATFLEARLQLGSGKAKSAIKILKRVEQQDASLLPEALPLLLDAYGQLGKEAELADYLQTLLRQKGGISIMLALAELIQRKHGSASAATFIAEQLRKRPSLRGMTELIALKLPQSQDQGREDLQLLHELTSRLIEKKPVYCCSHCGFTARTFNWLCPGCKHWNTIRPIQGIEGE